MQKKISLLLLSLLTAPMFIFGQHDHEDEITKRKCGHHEYVQMLMEEDPGFAERRAAIEMDMQQWIKDHPALLQGEGKTVYTIPVVVHVLYSSGVHNIPQTRIIEQIDVLNKDFRKANTDVWNTPNAWLTRIADVEFDYCLATRDPQGNWTNGVTRTQVTKTSFSVSDDNIIKSTTLGGANAWNTDKYLNIWVVNLTGGVLGYTQPPGGPSSKDGVVIGYKYFGVTGASNPFNKGRTATHEIGHWFNLLHVWGDDNGACWGNDYVSDTPNQASEFYGCPYFPQKDICTPDSPGVMFMNYMDYVDDACMVMFTNGQKTRMISALNTHRSELITSNGCEPPVAIEEIPAVNDFTLYPNPGNGVLYMELILNIFADVNLCAVNLLGQPVWQQTYHHTGFLQEVIDLRHLEKGVYLFTLEAEGERITKRVIIQ